MNEHEEHLLAEVAEAMGADQVRLNLTSGISLTKGKSLGAGLQIETRGYSDRSWRKRGPLLFPPEGETLGSVLDMLVGMRTEAKSP